MHRLAIACLVLAAFPGCAGRPPLLPPDYAGPRAHIADSMSPRGQSVADLFYLSAVNGQKIDDSVEATSQSTSGRLFTLMPNIIGRDVPAKSATFSIRGTIYHTTPILTLADEINDMAGDVVAVPLPGHSYFDTGKLGSGYSAIWIEDRDTGEVLGRKIERKE